MDEGLLYKNSWKGRIIKAIAIDGAQELKEIEDYSGLSRYSLKRTITELTELGILTKYYKEGKSVYRVNSEIYQQYNSHFTSSFVNNIQASSPLALLEYASNYKTSQKEFNDMPEKHFYLPNIDILDFLLRCIKYTKKCILIVNLYIKESEIVSALLEVAPTNITVKLATQRPDRRGFKNKVGILYDLLDVGVEVYVDNSIHAKIIIFDEIIAIVSSFNFTKSSQENYWEAGMVSFSSKTVRNIVNSVNELTQKCEKFVRYY